MAVKKKIAKTQKRKTLKKFEDKLSKVQPEKANLRKIAAKRPAKNLLKTKRTNKKLLLGIFLLIIFSALIYFGKGLFIAAIVGKRPITRLQVVRELEKQGGKQALDNLITKELIFREASKQNISVSNKDVSTEIEKIRKSLEAQGTTLDAALALQGQTLESLEENIRIQKTLEQILKNEISVNEEEISKYFEENKSFYGENAKLEDLKETIRRQLEQEKLREAFSKWIEKTKSSTQIIYFVNY